MELEEGDVVLCTVEKIEGTVVFVKIDETQDQGSIITSEIAPGRIRNLRDYVVPKKKIVCKILKIDEKGNIYLSLRRVTQKEKKEVLEKDRNEKKLMSILRTILKDETEKVMQEIKKKADVISFFEESKTSPKELEKAIGKEKAKKIIDILNSQKQKKSVVKKEFFLKTNSPSGIELIKKMLETNEAEIRYLSAGKYSIKIESSDIKKADGKIQEILKDIERLSKKGNMEFSVK
jgi:translation initiation factor 2 alpha subunit (eIF-2alpha)